MLNFSPNTLIVVFYLNIGTRDVCGMVFFLQITESMHLTRMTVCLEVIISGFYFRINGSEVENSLTLGSRVPEAS